MAFAKRSFNRGGAITAIQINWKQLNPHLANDKDALREERLSFIADVLDLPEAPESITDLSNKELGIVLDAMKEEQRKRGGNQLIVSPAPASGETRPVRTFTAKTETRKGSEGPAEVFQFPNATPEQKFTLEKLLNYLGWKKEFITDFLTKRYKTDLVSRLTAKQAHGLTIILLNSAASADLKAMGIAKPGRAGCAAYIPKLKLKLGIND